MLCSFSSLLFLGLHLRFFPVSQRLPSRRSTPLGNTRKKKNHDVSYDAMFLISLDLDTGHRKHNKRYYYKIMMSSRRWTFQSRSFTHFILTRSKELCLQTSQSIFFLLLIRKTGEAIGRSVNSGSNDCWLKVKDRIMVITENVWKRRRRDVDEKT